MDHAALLDRFVKDDCVSGGDRIPQLPRALNELLDVFRLMDVRRRRAIDGFRLEASRRISTKPRLRSNTTQRDVR